MHSKAFLVRGTMPRTEAELFREHLDQLELGDGCVIAVHPSLKLPRSQARGGHLFVVTVIAVTTEAKEFLKMSFRGGHLRRNGWDLKFPFQKEVPLP